MKLKKLFAGIVAVAMMATMAMPGFAAGVDYTHGNSKESAKITVDAQGHAYLPVTKTFKVLEGTAPDTLDFTFKLENDKEIAPEFAGSVTATPDFSKDNYTVSFTKADNNNSDWIVNSQASKNFNIDLAGLGITHVGKYTYKLTETDGKVPGVVYDSNELKLVVSCVNANENEPDGTFAYYAALYRNGEKISASDAFHNYYGKDGDKKTVHSLTLSKNVKGEFADLTKIFKFKVVLTGMTGSYKNPTVAHSATDTHSSATTLEYGESVEQYIYLKRNESATINNLPDGVKVTITEISSDDTNVAEYRTTINNGNAIEGENERKYDGVAFVKGADDQTAAYVNTRVGTVDTGVILDNAPYIALLTIVAAGAVVMIMKKRRNYED